MSFNTLDIISNDERMVLAKYGDILGILNRKAGACYICDNIIHNYEDIDYNYDPGFDLCIKCNELYPDYYKLRDYKWLLFYNGIKSILPIELIMYIIQSYLYIRSINRIHVSGSVDILPKNLFIQYYNNRCNYLFAHQIDDYYSDTHIYTITHSINNCFICDDVVTDKSYENTYYCDNTMIEKIVFSRDTVPYPCMQMCDRCNVTYVFTNYDEAFASRQQKWLSFYAGMFDDESLINDICASRNIIWNIIKLYISIRSLN